MSNISIIIPIYNVASYIEECLRSVINQTYNNLEVLLIDDCGSDNTIELCENFISNYKGKVFFRIIKHHKNLGLSAARNTGLDSATGEYVYFLDSDDFLAPTAIENLYNAINKDSSYGIAISYFTKYVDEKGNSVYRDDWLFDEERVIDPEDFCYRMLTEKSNYASTAKLYKKSVVDTLRFQLGKRNEDTLFIIDLTPIIEKDNIKCIEIPDYSYYYRMREESICHNQSNPLAIDIIRNYDYAIEKCGDRQGIVEWVREKQLNFSIGLAKDLLNNMALPVSWYYDNCRFLKRYSKEYVAKHIKSNDYRMYLHMMQSPFLYRWYIKLRGRNV